MTFRSRRADQERDEDEDVAKDPRTYNKALDVRVYALAAFVNLNANLDQLAKSLKAKSVDENKPEAPPKADPYKAIHNRRPRTQNFATSWKT